MACSTGKLLSFVSSFNPLVFLDYHWNRQPEIGVQNNFFAVLAYLAIVPILWTEPIKKMKRSTSAETDIGEVMQWHWLFCYLLFLTLCTRILMCCISVVAGWYEQPGCIKFRIAFESTESFVKCWNASIQAAIVRSTQRIGHDTWQITWDGITREHHPTCMVTGKKISTRMLC